MTHHYVKGDLVWCKYEADLGKETPEVIVCAWNTIRCAVHPEHRYYRLENGLACGAMLRPRRDDYQQKEGLGNLNVVNELMNDLVEA